MKSFKEFILSEANSYPNNFSVEKEIVKLTPFKLRGYLALAYNAGNMVNFIAYFDPKAKKMVKNNDFTDSDDQSWRNTIEILTFSASFSKPKKKWTISSSRDLQDIVDWKNKKVILTDEEFASALNDFVEFLTKFTPRNN